jgi:hypothetical protein
MVSGLREWLRQLLTLKNRRLESYSPPLVSPATSCELVRVDLTDFIEKGIPVLLTKSYGA